MIPSSTRFTCRVLLFLLCALQATAQQTLPIFTHTTGTVLSNTNGNWLRVDPAQPNNIDLIESRIFEMPKKGSGVVAIEFKLVGGDGGTAHYQSGAYNQFANGGKGGEVNYRLNLNGTNTYGKPFLVTFGKKGESTSFDKGLYCSAGGGGSTGMLWLVPQAKNWHLFKRWGGPAGEGRLIAGAGGGSGGFATVFEAVSGKSAVRDASSNHFTTGDEPDIFISQSYSDAADKHAFTLVAGGSGIDIENQLPAACCTDDLKMRQASSVVYSVFTFQTGVVIGGSNSVLQSVTQGQTGGKPTVLYTSQTGTPFINALSMGSYNEYPLLKAGGRGGSGMAGGGAGSSTVMRFDIESFGLERRRRIPTSGAGGTGMAFEQSQPSTDLVAADDGYNDYSRFLDNVSISPRTSTNNPQSGYFMYRTIADTEPPVINVSNIDVNPGNGKLYPFYSANTPLTMALLEPYLGKQNGIYDNDAIKSITFSKTELTCSDVGDSVPVNITVTDFAGNSTSGTLLITVRDTFTPVATIEYSPDILDPGLPLRVDVTSGPYTLTAANFPKGYDGCKANNVRITFPPATFNCTHAGIPQPVTYYYTDSDGNQSPTYTKTFNVVYNAAFSKLYVDHTATGANNGSSWANAYTSLQNALQNTCSSNGREIYIATGTYSPDFSNRNATFTLRANDRLYGGFPNGGDTFENRNPQVNPVILSGELASPHATDNSYHVVTITGSKTVLEGFTIRGGYADNDADTGGGGLVLRQTEINLSESHHATIRNCKFLDNYGTKGGAVYTDHRNASLFNYLNFQNCLFEDNHAASDGGAVYLSNQTIWDNMRQTFVNCVFHNNSATSNSGALHAQPNSKVSVVNCTFAYNSAGTSAGAVGNWGTVLLHNSILYFDTVAGAASELAGTGVFEADYSIIQGSGGSGAWSLSLAEDKGNNLDTDPLFYASPSSTLPTLTLTLQSPARNSGRNDYNGEPYDATGFHVRVSQDVIDMGAYETNSVVYVAADAANGGDGSTWAAAMNNLNEAIEVAGTGSMQRDIWIKEGIYRPDRVASINNTPTPGNRENTFNIRTSKVYGGFAGNETSISQRNIGLHPTILSGDIGVQNNLSDNVYHVLTSIVGDSRLDGLIIEGGNADGEGENANGGGLIEFPGADAKKTVVNCVFRNNHATGFGGAVYVTEGRFHPVTNFVQCVFYGNTAAQGAAVYLSLSNPHSEAFDMNFHHVTAVNNISSTAGAGAFEAREMISSRYAKISFVNSLLVANTPQNYSDAGNPGRITLTNTYTHATGTGVFANAINPAGADGKMMTSDDGLQLSPNSPAISFGDQVLAFAGLEKDITGAQRVLNRLDAGAYESPYAAPITPENGIIYVKQAATGEGTGSSWQHATSDLHNAIHTTGVQKVFVATGTYKVGENSFIMRNGVEIYGGFDPDNGIVDLSHKRIMPATSTKRGSVLDGENVRPVIWNIFTSNDEMDNSAVLDGFMITQGAFPHGAGVRNVHASPTLRNLVIWNNRASVAGAGVFNENSSPLITNALIGGNEIANSNAGATGYGAGVYNGASSATVLTNVTITDNVLAVPAGNMKGAGVYSNNSSPEIYNSIIWNNQKSGNSNTSGADLENEGTVSLSLKNSITQIYSTGNPDDHNKVATNPLFTTDYSLPAASPAVDAGDNAFYPDLTAGTQDLAGNPRVSHFGSNKPVDMGAYESKSANTRWYVNAAQDGPTRDGASWATALARLEEGIAAAKSGDTVWVAKGSYVPKVAGTSFEMKSGVKIYGGFAATEIELADRDLGGGHNAILEGNGASVIVNADVDDGALLDGFVIQNGTTSSRGGAVRNSNSNIQFQNVVFTRNEASDGGAIANIGSHVTIRNAVFYANQANQNGGAIHNEASSTDVIHVTFYGNSAQNGSVSAQQDGGELMVGNSISWGNTGGEWHSSGAASATTVTFSLLQSDQDGAGNFFRSDPKFSYPDMPAGFDGFWFTADDGLTASNQSRFMNKGDNALAAGIGRDIIGSERVQQGIADMGAYESSLPDFCENVLASGSGKLYVNAGVPATGDGLSWSGAFKTLTEALEIANSCNAVDTIWIAEGTYYPTGSLSTGDRSQSFVITRSDINLLGGFSSSSPATRNAGLHKTILSGNINDDALTSDNSFHVIRLNASGGHITLDGLTITGGIADGALVPNKYGGGLYSDDQGTRTSLTITNCIFTQNAAGQGGAIYGANSDLSFTNVAITDNRASHQGGGIESISGSVSLINTTVAGNASPSAVEVKNGAFLIRNSIVYGAVTEGYLAYHSMVTGVALTDGNIDASAVPLEEVFNNTTFGDFGLKTCSPAINAGMPDVSALDLPEVDLAGQERIFGDQIDMGAYENVQVANNTGIVSGGTVLARSQKGNGTTQYRDPCNLLAVSIATSGEPSSIRGNTTATVWVDAVQNSQYVKRHFQIMPTTDGETSTGRLTLYFTQQEFDAFNAVNTTKLPARADDSAGKSNLLIEKKGGVSSDGSGLPATYQGSLQTINPSDSEINWDSSTSRWEVSFEVTGFSGFFVKTTSAALPVRWISFAAKMDEEGYARLEWKVDQTNVSDYQIERSGNARGFRPIGRVAGSNDGRAQYSFTDSTKVTGTVYYRIRQSDLDATFSYSKITSVNAAEPVSLAAYPNPVKERVTLHVSPAYIGTRLRLASASGVTLQQLEISGQTVTINLDKYTAGVYIVSTFDGKVVKLIKY
ncbi:choice-of-anchor Q domain-containing protein [Dyadobacter sp. CY323]|uniref:choice-of-anchor Q domain-containing protein n=1 Tax=Dyadobacter sp. CY323 TaxID=2907302 RepID=UPI001F3E5D0B|nr:choice-of-anchor Q domain-containing protein [Dyadobacter sp. CY323]MCE6991159.1 hypothetical protein [Dyadobacter sp. CY323]